MGEKTRSKYKNAAGADGVQRVLLKGGADRKAKIVVKAEGADLHLPALPLLQDPTVVVQLKNNLPDGKCWESRYTAPAAKNGERNFKDKADPARPTPTVTPTPSPAPSGPTATPTPTPTGPTPTFTNTHTPTPTFTPANSVYGNGFLEPGENFRDPTAGLVGGPDGVSCPADAQVLPCSSPFTGPHPFQVLFDAPIGTNPSTVTAVIGYRSNIVAIPGSASASSVRQRFVIPPPAPFLFTPNDRDYAVRAVTSRTAGIDDGLLYTIQFDGCSGAGLPTAADFGCIVEGCSGVGAIDGCTCTVVSP